MHIINVHSYTNTCSYLLTEKALYMAGWYYNTIIVDKREIKTMIDNEDTIK